MQPFNLYYLVDDAGNFNPDPNADIAGPKELQGSFASLAAAKSRAVIDAIIHYSVEQDQGDGINFSIVYIC